MIKSKGLKEIKPSVGTFIQFACAPNQMVSDDLTTDSDNLFTKYLLKNIAQENIDVTDVFRRIVEGVSEGSNKKQQPLSMNGLDQHQPVYLNHVIAPVESKLKRSSMKSSALYSHVAIENTCFRN
jgi:hypothetical protein